MIKPEILSYVQEQILPRYVNFDRAHNTDHVNKVIANSMAIAAEHEVNIDMVYVIAAYHDIALDLGRMEHEKNSAAFLLADDKLKEWFTNDERILMAQAVEDHRASNDYTPRSIYGLIISEADRDIDYITILTRTIQYSLKNFPEYSIEQHYVRTVEHFYEKYAEGGYLKLWLNTELNRRRLDELRSNLAQPEILRADFDRIFAEQTK